VCRYYSRWAKKKGLPPLEGHRRGFLNIEPNILFARDTGIKHVVVYAFSTENWNRTKEEVSYLMRLFEEMAKRFSIRLAKERVAVRFVGQRERFSKRLQQLMANAEYKSQKNPDLTLWVCLSYGGRAEIVKATKAVVKTGGEITEESIGNNLWTKGMPDPEIVIRTSSEYRTSNFLVWQSVYSELFFPKVFWPEFSKNHFKAILKEYSNRKRRFGK